MGSVGTPIIGRPRPSHPPRHASQTQPPATPRIAKSRITKGGPWRVGVGCVGVVAGPGFPVLADTCRGSGPHAFTCRLSTGAVPVEWPLGRVNTSPQGWMSAPGNGGPRISEPVHATDRGRPNHDKPATPQPQPLTRTRKPVARSLSPDACSSTPLSMVTRRGEWSPSEWCTDSAASVSL